MDEKYKECEQCVGNGAAGAEVYYTEIRETGIITVFPAKG